MATTSKGYNLSTHVNNFNLSYDDVGEGTIPLIFLHGFPFDKSSWQFQLEELSSSFRVIACDIRGFGESKDERSPLSIDVFTEDLVCFMDKLHISKAIVCGLSMGGYIALKAQQKFPDRFEVLILCDTQCNADTPEAKEKRYKAIDDIAANGVDGFNDAFIKRVFCPDTLANKKSIVDQLRTVVYSNSPYILSQGLKALAERSETCSTLEDIAIPTLIICGKEDELTPPAQSEYLNQYIKGSILRVIENAGHVSNLEQPEEFNKHIKDFLSTLSHIRVEEMIENQSNMK